jgi:hypothetical protein
VNRTRAQAGSHAKLVGDLHEGWCEQQLDKAVHLGIVAHYYHNQPTAKYIGGKWVLTAPGVSDYTGVLERNGEEFARTLAVEAKTVEGTRFYKKGVTQEQQEHLDAVAAARGLALLAVSFRVPQADGRVQFHRFVIPWREIRWQRLKTQESINLEPTQTWLRQWDPDPMCFLLRWHPGGKRSGTWLPAGQRRVYATE